MNRNRILLGMSGGTDSSVAAIQLKEQGFDVVGVTLLTHGVAEGNRDIVDAQRLAESLQITHHVEACQPQFKKTVVDYFVSSYLGGRTPNPCVYCNKVIKWRLLLECASRFNCAQVATGHYVRKKYDNGNYYIQKGVDAAKDQSYFLWDLPQSVLEKACFPLGNIEKTDVKKMAAEAGFVSLSQKRESMGVCFLKNKSYHDFLREALPNDHPALKIGSVVDECGKEIGKHNGYPFYTIGQKKHIENLPAGYCVIKANPESNQLVVGKQDVLNCKEVLLHDFRLTSDEQMWMQKKVFVRIRGVDRFPGYFATLKKSGDCLVVSFDESVWALAPGQSVVFYQDDVVIGGGIIG